MEEEKKKDKKKKKDNEEVESLKQQVLDLQSKVMYGQAELINFRKRTDERIEDLLKYKNEDLLLDLTDVIENLDRALSIKTDNEESKKIQAGVALVNNQFKEILKKHGVTEIEAIGYPFDPNYMEAMMVETDDTKPDDMVLDVLRKGYMYKDRVLKHAMVKVNKNDKEKKGNE